MKTKINFIKLKKPTLALSIILILLSLFFVFGPRNVNLGPFTPKGFNLGIDFKGGVVHQLVIYSGIPAEDISYIRSFSEESDLGNEIQEVNIREVDKIGKARSYLIKATLSDKKKKELIDAEIKSRETSLNTTEDSSVNNEVNNTEISISNDEISNTTEGETVSSYVDITDAKLIEERIKTLYRLISEKYGETYELVGEELEKANRLYPNSNIPGELTELRTDDKRVVRNVVKESENTISTSYSKNLQKQAFFLVLFILGIMLLYISFRFKFQFALGAVIGLIHNVIISLGFVSVTGLEFDMSIVAALLTLIGYSINDTIVIFDRIRENYNVMRGFSSNQIFNTSINQTLSRTIATSLTTELALVALLIWGGTKLFGFSITLFVGIIIGTYSSVFIASPIVSLWERIFNKKDKVLIEKDKEKEKEKKLIIENGDSDIPNREQILHEIKEESITNISKSKLKKLSDKKKK